MSAALDYAQRYAAAGFKVFPLHSIIDGSCTCGIKTCISPGKHPRTDNGSHGASDNAKNITDWWTRWPGANIAMTLAGLVVIDVDPRNGGSETFDDLVATHQGFPQTWTQRTGGGGAHYVFRARPGIKYKGALGAGVDLKHGDFQYIVVEPSIHQSGQTYVWMDEEGPIYGGTLSDAPEWLGVVSEEARKERRADGAGRYHSGGRNNALYERARRLRDIGLSQREIYGALIIMNEERCLPPLPAAEVQTICKSAAQNEPKNERRNIGGFVDVTAFMKTFAPPVWLVGGIIQMGYVYSLTALTNHGKTAIATSLALSIARGVNFGDIRITQGRVLYLCGENPQDFNSRLHGAYQHFGIRADELTDWLFVYPIADKLSNLRQEILNFCEEIGGFSLIIIDTSVAYFSYTDENDNIDARQHGQDFRSLVASIGSPAILTLSHPIKNAEQNNLVPRGGSGFLNEIDGNLTAYKTSETVIELWHTKIRGPGFKAIHLTLQEVVLAEIKDSYGDEVRSIVAKPITEAQAESNFYDDLDVYKAVVVEMYDSKLSSLSAIARNLRWFETDGETANRSKVSRAVKKLEKERYVERDLEGVRLTDKGRKYAAENKKRI